MSDLALTANQIQLGNHFRIGPAGLSVIGDPPIEAAEQLGRALGILDEATPLALGDFVNFAEAAYGEKASQILDAADGWAKATRKVYAWVCKNVPRENRLIPPLTFGHLQVVAELSPDAQRVWLDHAVLGDEHGPLSIAKLKQQMAAAEGDKTHLRFLLIVDCDTEIRQTQLAARLEGDGYGVTVPNGVGKAKKVSKKKETA